MWAIPTGTSLVLKKKKKKNQVKSPSPESRVPETGSDPPIGSGRDSGRDTHPDPACLFFSILKLVSFKKLNRAGRRWENSQTRPVYILFLFLFLILFYYLIFYFYYIKINIFHKNKNIMNFYKLFIKKHYNNNYYLY